jgi:PAS domain S-box-containing protein
MWVADMETLKFLEVNDAALAHYGYSRDEFLRLTMLDIRPAEDIPRFQEDMLLPRPGFREAGVWRHCLKDGRIIWLQIANHLTEWKGRKAILVVAQDITESRRNEEALCRTEELFRRAFEEAPFGMCLTGLDGRFLQANGALCQMLGYSAEELKGGAWESITHPDDIERSRRAALQLMGNPVASVELEKRYIPKQGDIIWVRVKISTVMNSDRKPSHWIAHIEDITERKRAREELVRAKEAAEAASRAKSEFLANMSHEIRTPMNGILGMTELALASALSEEQRDYLNTVRTSAEALLDIINDILDFSKIEARKLTLSNCEFSLGQTLQEIMRMMAVPAHEKGLELLYENRADLPERLLGDPGRLRQVVVNLIGNAIKFTPSGEVLLSVLEAHERGHDLTIHVAVSDTGIGVAPEWQDRIFEAFVQEDGSKTRCHGGTGLGLAICSRLVGYMGGRMWVESAPGHGSVFHFTANFGRPAAGRTETPPVEARLLHGLNILAVDSNATNLRILHDTLVRWHMNPVLAGSISAGLDAVRELARSGKHFDAILIDAHLQGADSLTPGGQVPLEGTIVGPRIAMLSSLDIGSLGPELRASGHYLVKPVTPANLLESLLRALGKGPARALTSSNIPIATALRPLHILVAEDNMVNQKVVARLVEKMGHSVEITSTGAQALAACARDTFDLILMDVQMPVMNGFDATQAIRERERKTGRHIPIVALTAHAMKEDREMCLAAGMDDYLGKPIQPRELASVLERWGTAESDAGHGVEIDVISA